MLMLIWTLLQPEQLKTERLLQASVYPGGGAGGWWGPVVKRPPQTGSKQPAGGIEEAPCCTDWPDSSDSSGEDRLFAGRWEDLSSYSGTPPPLTSPCKNPSLSHLQSHPTSSLSLHLTVFLLLGFFAGSQTVHKKLFSPNWALNLNSCPDFIDPSPLTSTRTDCSCLSCFFSLWSSKNNKLTCWILYV